MVDIVRVKVKDITPAGIYVEILGDDRTGFIRRKELSWDNSVEATPPRITSNQILKTKVLHKDRKGQVYLSLRQLTDPWKQVKNKYYEGQLVQGEVVHIRYFGAFVQIEPGIDAILRPKEVPLLPSQLIEEVLSVGDRVQGLVTRFDIKRQKMAISITDWLQELSRLNSKERRRFQVKLFREMSKPTEGSRSQNHLARSESETVQRYYCPPIQRPNSILVVDDEKHYLTKIKEYLVKKFQVEVVGVSNGQEALREFKSDSRYDLVVMDIMLSNENGIEIVEKLRDIKLDLAIVYTSADPTVRDRIPNLADARTVFADKDVDEIIKGIEDLCHGYWKTVYKSDVNAYTGLNNFIHQLGMTALADHSLVDTLHSILTQFKEETRVSHCMVLEVDSGNEEVSILAAVPPLEHNILEHSLDALYYSPVQDVVDYEQEYYATAIDPRHNRRLKNFFPLLSFHSCLGIPLNLPNFSSTKHALFVLDGRKELSPAVIAYAGLVSEPLKVALERSLLLDYMIRYEQRYTMGQLVGNLVHELSNKIGGLKNNVEILPRLLDKFDSATASDDQEEYWEEITDTVHELNQTKNELAKLAEAYSRLAKRDFEEVDVNQVVEKTSLQLQTKAKELGVEIHLDKEIGLPRVKAVQTHLEQIMTNLVLNAIQQTALQSQILRQITKQRGKEHSILQGRQTIIQTRYSSSKSAYPIQVCVIDTGPGVHYHQKDRLFLMDDTTREEGHGLGLFISKNLVEDLGGRIRLVKSIMFVGSAFLIELPISKDEG